MMKTLALCILMGALSESFSFLHHHRATSSSGLKSPMRPRSQSRLYAMDKSLSRDDLIKGVLAFTSLIATTAGSVKAYEYVEDDDAVVKSKSIQEYLDQVDKYNIRVADFPKSLEWVNCGPISLQKDLKGKVVLLDFWTFCCVNCLHILPILARFEKKYKDQPFEVIGVHSAKFANEKDTASIREAISRNNIKHPVVNDKDMTMWSAVGVSSWPSLVLVSPKGTLLSIWAGEGYGERIDQFIEASLKYYDAKGLLDRNPLALPKPRTSRGGLANSPLSYPGKVHVDPTLPRLFVSDSGNNRVLVVNRDDGSIMASIGSSTGEAGFQDGTFETARFSNPQGLCLSEDGSTLYVCDTDSHAIRAIDLVGQKVRTLAGNGEQGFDYTGGKAGKNQYLSTPWDTVMTKLPDRAKATLLVAMAGIHQLWEVDPVSGKAGCYSGTGREREQNARDRINSAWAQPSGLALSLSSPPTLYVADSESSTVREMLIEGPGRTRTIVGGAGVPENLFAYGDKDGKGTGARLQHPLGVAAVKGGGLVVADSYNHKLKLVDPETNSVKTIAGAEKAGLKDGKGGGASFWEPGGVAADPSGEQVWIADTNNHAIRVLNVAQGQVSTFEVKNGPGSSSSSSGGGDGDGSSQRSIVNRRRAKVINLGKIGRTSTITLQVTLPESLHFTEERPSEWRVVDPEKVLATSGSTLKGPIEAQGKDGGSSTVTIQIKAEKDGPVEIESAVYYCLNDRGVCLSNPVVFQAQVTADGPNEVVARQDVKPKKGATQGVAQQLNQTPKQRGKRSGRGRNVLSV